MRLTRLTVVNRAARGMTVCGFFTPLPPTLKSSCPALFQITAVTHTDADTETHTAGQTMIGWGWVAVSAGVLTLSVPRCHHCLEDDNRMDGGRGTEWGRWIRRTTCERRRGGGWTLKKRWMRRLWEKEKQGMRKRERDRVWCEDSGRRKKLRVIRTCWGGLEAEE